MEWKDNWQPTLTCILLAECIRPVLPKSEGEVAVLNQLCNSVCESLRILWFCGNAAVL
jgi:hypothetical protein